MDAWKTWARAIKRDASAVYFAAKDPRTPWYAKLLAAVVVAYAFSPIDLIPDPIPILGYLDDLILIPLGVALVVRLVPPAVIAESRVKAQEATARPTNWIAAVVIVAFWLLVALLAVRLVMQTLEGSVTWMPPG